METTKLKLGSKDVFLLAGAAVLLAALILFGFAGIKTIVVMFLFLFLPAYLFFDLFDFELEEKIFFAAATGLALFPLAVWFINRIIPSFRASVIAVFVLAVAIAVFFRSKKKSKGDA